VAKWTLVALLLLQAHFAASYLVPLDEPSQREFGGLLRWFWPWSQGNRGPFGEITGTVLPLSPLVAVIGGTALFGAALSVLGWWVPYGWWRPLAIVGAVLSFFALASFLGPTKFLPMASAVAIVWIAYADPWRAVLR
jgi:hypothetical protein